MFARLENNIVMEVMDVEMLPEFHPDLIWVTCTSEVGEGFIYDNSIFIDPESLITAEGLIPAKLLEISSLYHEKIGSGFLYDGNLYHLDATARSNMGMMKLEIDAGAISPHGGAWIGLNGVYTLSDVQVLALAEAARLAYRGLLFAKSTHEITIKALTEKGAVLSYDVEAGWP
ncbi:MAG: hypothetical protein JKY93_01160 [Gammaproteobacteria bacterium]|nr:hypothetical protein [Gammaproteobacteria bacterium]